MDNDDGEVMDLLKGDVLGVDEAPENEKEMVISGLFDKAD